MMPMEATPATTSLIQYIVGTYFAHLTSVLIVYDGDAIASKDSLQQEYLDAVQQAFYNQSRHGKIIGLQWINVKYFNDAPNEDEEVVMEVDTEMEQQDFGEQILKAVDIVTEGFITILTNTSRFLHARYYATRYATLRLKDKIYLFLCEHENPAEFLASELLQFYPHHLMVTPATIDPSANANANANDNHNSEAKERHREAEDEDDCSSKANDIETPNQNSKQTCAKYITKETPKNFILRLENIAMGHEEAATSALHPESSSPSRMSSTTEKANDKDRDINFELWTQRYVGAEGNLNATQLDTFRGQSQQFAKNAELYPNKLRNLQRRVMRVGTLTYVPYVKTNYVDPGEGDEDSIDSEGPNKTVIFQGAEADLLRSFCQKHDCHLRLQPYPADNWGIIFENGTSEGMLGDLYEQQTEMAIGCIYNWYNNIMEVSQFMARSAVTILGPGPTQFPRWRTNIMPFSTSLWLFLFGTMIICSIMFQFVKYSAYRLKKYHTSHKSYGLKNFEKTMLDIFAVFIQQPSADTVLHRVASRIFLAFLLCATITLENTYSGQLKSILTMPLFNEPIDTIDKWSLTHWKWAAPSIIWIQTVERSDVAKEQRLVASFEVRDHDFMYNASFRDDYGLALERLYSGSLNVDDYITVAVLGSKIILKDDLYFDWTRAVAIRGWPLMPLLDQHILFCLEAGLYIYWERQNNFRFMDRQLQDILIEISTGYIPKPPPQKLSIDHISGPIFILLFGYLTAFLVLLLEMSANRIKLSLVGGRRHRRRI